LEKVKGEDLLTYAILEEGVPGPVSNGRVAVMFGKGFSFHREKLSNGKSRDVIERALKNTYGEDVKFEALDREVEAAPKVSGGEKRSFGLSTQEIANIFSGKVL
jgi:hypothetical protein